MDAIALGVCLFDGDERLIVSNRRYAEIYGLRPSRSVPALRCARSSSFASPPEPARRPPTTISRFARRTTSHKEPTTWTAELGMDG